MQQMLLFCSDLLLLIMESPYYVICNTRNNLSYRISVALDFSFKILKQFP